MMEIVKDEQHKNPSYWSSEDEARIVFDLMKCLFMAQSTEM